MASRTRKRTVAKSAVAAPPEVAAPLFEQRSWLWLWLFAAGAILAGAVYLPALDGPFIFDDTNLPFNNPDAHKMPWTFWVGGVRPVLMASYWANYIVSGTHTLPYHAVNLIFHAATATVVFFVLQRLLKLAGVEGRTFLVSLFGAGLFLLHPLQTESAAYIAGRSELVSGLLLLSAWLVFLNHFENPTTLLTALKVLLLALAAVLGKESAISLPGVLLVTDLYWNQGGLLTQIRGRLKLYVPIVLGGLAGGIAIVRSLGQASNAGLSTRGVTPLQYLLTQCRVILTYIRLFLFPVGQNGDWHIRFYRSITDGGAWIYVLGMLILLAAIAWSYRRARLVSFGLLVFLVLLMPTSSVVPISDALAERRMYIPIVGLVLAAIALVQYLHLDSVSLRALGISVLVLAAILTFQRSRVWGDDVAFWQDILKANPGNGRAHLGLGGSYMLHSQYTDAIKEYDAVDKLEGVKEETILNRAAANEMMQNFDLALDNLHKAASMNPTPKIYTEIGRVEAYIGHLQESLAGFTSALGLNPRYAPAYAQRGMVYLATGNYDRAKSDFQNALAIDPRNETALKGVSRLPTSP